MTEQTYEQRAAARLRKEFEEFDNNQQATSQPTLDRYWQSKLDLEAEHRRMMRELKEEFPRYLQTMRDAGWTSRHREAQEDYDAVVAELFDGDRLRPSALAERARRRTPPE